MKAKTFHLIGTLVIALALLAATAQTASAQPPLPDLTVESLSPDWVPGNTSYYVTFWIINRGTAIAGACTAGVYVDGILQDSGPIPSLNPGVGGLFGAGPFTISEGRDKVLVRADIFNEVAESDEENNSESVYVSTGGGCFIATSALGPNDSSVDTLRAFRDTHLATNPVGSGFISAYYRLSPPVAGFIDDHPALKPVVRVALLPAVGVSEASGMGPAVEVAIVATMLLASAMAVVWVRRRTILS